MNIEDMNLIITQYEKLKAKAEEIVIYYLYNYKSTPSYYFIDVEIIFSSKSKYFFSFVYDLCERDTSYIMKHSSGNLQLSLLISDDWKSDLKNFVEK